MSQLPFPEAETKFKPSFEQLQRQETLRRYNRWALYLPLGLLFLLVMAVLIGMIWLSFEGMPQMERWRSFVSSMADTVIILTSMGGALTCLIVPGLAIGLTAYGRNQEWAPINRLQQLLWRLESGLIRVKTKVDEIAAKSASGVIEGRSRLAYWDALIKWLKYWITGR